MDEKEAAEEKETAKDEAECQKSVPIKKDNTMKSVAAIILVLMLLLIPIVDESQQEAQTERKQASCAHTDIVVTQAAVIGSCTEEGRTAEKKCTACGKIFSAYSTGYRHSYNSESVCTLCGAKDYSTYVEWFNVDDDDEDYWLARTAAQDLVKEKLKSPSTAKFPSTVFSSAYTVKWSGTKWKVSGYVDAQNSFGATIREYWTATFEMGSASGGKYKVSNYSVSFR